MGTVKLVLGIAVIVAVVVLGAAIIPPYFNNYQFEDALNSEVLTATYSNKSEEDIRGMVYKRAREMDIPIKPEEIKVQRVGSMGTGSMAVEANYTVHVDLPGYPLDLQFHAATKNKGIY
jgi:YbbR domain-containing protein